MKRPDLQLLRVATSTGNKTQTDPDTGAEFEWGRPCPRCEGPIESGENIVKIARRWYHHDCGTKVITSADVRDAWVMIGMDVARSPRAYPVREVRTVIEHLIQIATERSTDDY